MEKTDHEDSEWAAATATVGNWAGTVRKISMKSPRATEKH